MNRQFVADFGQYISYHAVCWTVTNDDSVQIQLFFDDLHSVDEMLVEIVKLLVLYHLDSGCVVLVDNNWFF